MKKLFIPLLFTFSIIGCATTTNGVMKDVASAQYTKIDNSNVKITGELITPWERDTWKNSVTWHRHLNIYFDDKPVIDGDLSNPKDVQGELSGKYNDKKITSICSSVSVNATTLKTDCMILINNERTVTLTF